MPPLVNSRFSFCTGLTDEKGNLYLTEREPFTFVDLPDNRPHMVVVGDTLEGLAERYFPSFGEQAAQLYWVIADFQPERIRDKTLRLAPGRVLIVPSETTIRERVLNPSRREEHTA
jgi:hypothetical protein